MLTYAHDDDMGNVFNNFVAKPTGKFVYMKGALLRFVYVRMNSIICLLRFVWCESWMILLWEIEFKF